MLQLLTVFTYLTSGLFVTYVITIVVPFLRRRPDAPGDASRFEWHFFVPCRDEETVIGATLRRLRESFPDAHVWVIDDDSRDRTAAVVEVSGAGDPRVHLVRRRPPEARTGKGDALNAAYRQLNAWLGAEGNRDEVIVGVVDADGELAGNCLDLCAGTRLFGDRSVGAVQIEVRMINRDAEPDLPGPITRWLGRKLVQVQDLEFRTAIAAIQHSRAQVGTVAMGGNGQFTRLSALDSITPEGAGPWRGLLLEDYELGLHLLMAGWRTAATTDTHVSQEGLYHFPRFLTQRTRWGQGTMQCARYLPAVWRNKHFGTLGVLEISYYLLQPWLQLVGAVLYPVPLAVVAAHVIGDPGQLATGSALVATASYVLVATAPFLVWGFVYETRCLSGRRLSRCLLMGVLFTGYVLTFYLTSVRAVTRILRGRNGWAKTRRNGELSSLGRTAIES